MKKNVIALLAGVMVVLASCTKENDVKPAKSTINTAVNTALTHATDDSGGEDNPPPPPHHP